MTTEKWLRSSSSVSSPMESDNNVHIGLSEIPNWNRSSGFTPEYAFNYH